MRLIEGVLQAMTIKDLVKMLERFVKAHENIAKELKKADDLKAAEARRGGRA